jgi:hypothetical protein
MRRSGAAANRALPPPRRSVKFKFLELPKVEPIDLDLAPKVWQRGLFLFY